MSRRSSSSSSSPSQHDEEAHLSSDQAPSPPSSPPATAPRSLSQSSLSSLSQMSTAAVAAAAAPPRSAIGPSSPAASSRSSSPPPRSRSSSSSSAHESHLPTTTVTHQRVVKPPPAAVAPARPRNSSSSSDSSSSSSSSDTSSASRPPPPSTSFSLAKLLAFSQTLSSRVRSRIEPLRPYLTQLHASFQPLLARAEPHLAKARTYVHSYSALLREDVSELRRSLRSMDNRPVLEWSQRQLALPRTRLALVRVLGTVFFCLFLCVFLLQVSPVLSLKTKTRPKHHEDFPPAWRRTRELSYPELMSLINVYETKLSNDTSIPIKKLPTLDKPVYLSMSSKELVQIKRPAVRKKRPDEPRAVRTFGCLRDGCRGLEIEDLLDRGWQMRFRAAQKNDTYKNINYRVTFLLTDTTQLNHMQKVRPDLFKMIYEEYERKCYLIAFDGGDAIGGNKGQQLKVKEKFVRRYGCKFNELAIAPASYRLYIQDECEDLSNLDSLGITWLLKPEAGSQGQGITFHSEVSEIVNKQPKFFPCSKRDWKATERFLVQEYIEKPLLLKKSKFDVRVYMNIASSNPFLVFYHEGYLRRALAIYQPMSRDRRVYLTNTHFQSMKKDFKLSEHIWSFQEFGEYLRDQGRTGSHYIGSILNPMIKKIALFIFHSARYKLRKRKGTFHIFGLDFMLDEDWHVWFIEANGFPGFTWSINFDTRTMVEEWFNLAQQIHENPRFYMLMQSGDRFGGFEMIFSELEEERTQNLYNPCQEFKFNRGYTAPLKEANRRFALISGKGGRTEKFKHYTSGLKGANALGGPRSDVMASLEAYFSKYNCHLSNVKFMPATVALYDNKQCQTFFSEPGEGPFVVKPVSSPGNAEEFRVYATQDQLKEEFGLCSSRVPDYLVQHLIPKRILVSNKWWDIKVYMLVARTNPVMIFYTHGFARSAKLVNIPGSEEEEAAEAGGGGNSEKTGEEEEDEDEVGGGGGETRRRRRLRDEDDDEGGDDEDEDRPSKSSKSKKSSATAKKEATKPQQQQSSSSSSSEDEAEDDGPPEKSPDEAIPEPPAASTPNADAGAASELEAWAPNRVLKGATWTLGDEFVTLENLEDTMARADLAGSRWLSSVFDTYAKRIALTLFLAARPMLRPANESYQLTSLNFLLDDKMQIHFVGSRNVEPDSMPNVEILGEHKANFLESIAGLVLEMHDMPAAFARMRRGDSYGPWRLIFSEFEEKQRELTFDPCEEFRRNLQVAKSSLYKNAWLHQHKLKSTARNKRELRKHIMRKWESMCKMRPTKELQASCMTNTISYRYKIYLEKEKLEYQDGFVAMTIAALQAQEKQNKGNGGGEQGGGL